jgi:protein-disulfide isomerase
MKPTPKDSRKIKGSSVSKPVMVIIAAILLAAGAGYLLTRDRSVMSSPAPGTPVALQSGTGHARGPANAPITLVEFGDYQCPTCGHYYPIVEEVLHRFPTQVRFEFHHFPLVNAHHNALAAATAAEAAGEQNHFWEMHDMLYKHQDDWSNSADPEDIFAGYATQIGIDVNKFRQDMQSPAVGHRITDDVVRALDAKVPGTPTFLINGKMITTPKTVDDFAQVIQQQLNGK